MYAYVHVFTQIHTTALPSGKNQGKWRKCWSILHLLEPTKYLHLQNREAPGPWSSPCPCRPTDMDPKIWTITRSCSKSGGGGGLEASQTAGTKPAYRLPLTTHLLPSLPLRAPLGAEGMFQKKEGRAKGTKQ